MSARAPTVRGRTLPRGVPLVVTAVLVLIVVVYFAHWAHRDGLDLQVYRAGIASWRSGHNPYDGAFTAHHLEFTYPPFALLALYPLTWAPLAITQVALWTGSIIALAGAVYVVCLHGGCRGGRSLATSALGWVAFSVMVIEPVRSNLDYGQINTVLLCLVVVDLLAVPKRHRGWLVGLAAATKLTPLVFLALPVLERDWRTVARGIVAAAGATGLVWVFWPHVARTYWRNDVFAAKRAGHIGSASNQSLYGLIHRWPFPSNGQEAVWLVLAGSAAVMGLFIARQCLRDGRRMAAVLALAFVGLLVSPISWSHHWVWIALIPPFVLAGGNRALRAGTRYSLLLVVAVSVLAPYRWFTFGLPAEVLADSLCLAGVGLLAAWSYDEYRSALRTPVDDVSVPDIR